MDLYAFLTIYFIEVNGVSTLFGFDGWNMYFLSCN